MEESDIFPRSVTIYRCQHCSKYHQPAEDPQNANSSWLSFPFESDAFLEYCLSCIGIPENIRILKATILEKNFVAVHSFTFAIYYCFANDLNEQKRQKFIKFSIIDRICPLCEQYLSSEFEQHWFATVTITAFGDRTRPLHFLEGQIRKSFLANQKDTSHTDKTTDLYQACKSAKSIQKDDCHLVFEFNDKVLASRLVLFIRNLIAVHIEEKVNRVPKTHLDGFDPTNPMCYDFHVNYQLTLPGIWENDLVELPQELVESLDCNPICIVSSIVNHILVIDSETGNLVEISPSVYWDKPFPALQLRSSMVLFNVIDVIQYGPKIGRNRMCDVELTLSQNNLTENSSIFGQNHKKSKINMDPVTTRSHLGSDLKPGDVCLGYDLRNGIDSDAKCPDVIIVSKVAESTVIDQRSLVEEYLNDGIDLSQIPELLIVNKVPSIENDGQDMQMNCELIQAVDGLNV